MASLPTVIAVNQTGSDIFISDLGLEVPASGQLNLTELAAYFEITGSNDLCTLVDNGDILINDGNSTLNTSRSLLYLDSTGNVNAPTTAPSSETIPVFEGGTGRFLRNTSVTIDPSNNLDLGSGNLETTGTIGGINLQNHASRHESGGADEIEAGNLKESRTPTNYTGGATLDDHLEGIDVELGLIQDVLNDITSDLPAVQKRRSTTLAFGGAFADINLDTTDIETDPTILEADPANQDRILIKETGLYLFYFFGEIQSNSNADRTTSIKIRRNDSTDLPGGQSIFGTTNDDLSKTLNRVLLANVTAAGFISCQIGSASATGTLNADFIFGAIKMQGAKGADGAPGSGGGVTVQEEGVSIGAGTFSTLNFVGDSVTASDAGSSVANITVAGFTPNIFQARNTATLSVPTGGVVVPLNAEDFKDSNYIHSNVTNNSRVEVNETGVYKIYYSVGFDTSANSRRTLTTFLRINGTTEVVPSRGHGYARNNTDDNAQASGQAFVSLSSGDYVEIFAQSTGSSGNLTALANQMWMMMEFVR